MKKIIRYSLSILFIASVISACKKEGPQTPAGEIQGAWKLAKIGIDNDGNSFIAPSEIQPVSSGLNEEYTFYSNGTGVWIYSDNGSSELNQTFVWNIFDNDSLLVGSSAHDTATYYIELLNAANLSLIVNTSKGLVGYYFNKK